MWHALYGGNARGELIEIAEGLSETVIYAYMAK